MWILYVDTWQMVVTYQGDDVYEPMTNSGPQVFVADNASRTASAETEVTVAHCVDVAAEVGERAGDRA